MHMKNNGRLQLYEIEVFRPFFSDWLSKLSCFASLKEVEKNHKDDLVHSLQPIHHKEMGSACLKLCLHKIFLFVWGGGVLALG